MARRWGEARSRVPVRQRDALKNAQRNSIFFVPDAVFPPGREGSRGRSDWIPMVGAAASEAGYSGLQARDDAGDSAHNIWSGDSASVRVVVRVRMPKPLPLLSHHTTTSSSTNKQRCAPKKHTIMFLDRQRCADAVHAHAEGLHPRLSASQDRSQIPSIDAAAHPQRMPFPGKNTDAHRPFTRKAKSEPTYLSASTLGPFPSTLSSSAFDPAERFPSFLPSREKD